MRIYSWNINGIRSGWRLGLREWLEAINPEIVCLQETRADPELLPQEVVLPYGYESFWAISPRKGYSGVATYAHKGVVRTESRLNFDAEGRVLITNLGDFDLYNIYFPNSGMGPHRLEYKLAFYDAFLAHVDAQTARGRPLIVCGDVNTAHRPIDIAHPAANVHTPGFLPEERAHLDRWLEHGWVDVYRHFFPEQRGAYTWWSQRAGARERNVGWRLDYFFVHQTFMSHVKKTGISREVWGSDHCPVWLDWE